MTVIDSQGNPAVVYSLNQPQTSSAILFWRPGASDAGPPVIVGQDSTEFDVLDPYLLFADYQSYVDCQDHVGISYIDQENWSRMSIYNAARMGKFSSDRSIHEYCKNIWNVARFEAETAPPVAHK